MVLVKQLNIENEVVRYSYQPEKTGKSGILVYDFKNEKADIEKLAENDVESIFYRNHVFKLIRDIGLNEMKEERVLAWY